MLFRDRTHAGQMLAAQLKNAHYLSPVVIALPRGGVPVALEVAHALKAPLDVLMIRKIGHPSNPEYGIGAIGEDGEMWLDEQPIRIARLTTDHIRRAIEMETQELKRRIQTYRQGRELIPVAGHTAIIVDDGLATGVTARVAARYLKKHGAKKVVIAVPVCSPSAVPDLRDEADELISVNRPHLFKSVGQFYQEFPQLTDEEVLLTLKKVRRESELVRNPNTVSRLS